jgi:hypothetical protein
MPNLGAGAYDYWVLVVTDADAVVPESDERNPWKSNKAFQARDSASAARPTLAVARNGSALQLTISGMDGRIPKIQSIANPGIGPWIDVPTGRLNANGPIILTFPIVAGNPTTFYRVIAVPR